MQLVNRLSAITLGAALVLAMCVTFVRAAQPPQIPAYSDGQLVTITVVNSNVVAISRLNRGQDNNALAAAANPIYFFPSAPANLLGDQLQPHVLSIGLGQKGYNPYWHIVAVVVLNGRDLTSDPFLSEEEILDAWDNDEVALTDEAILLLCQQISK